MGVPKDLVGQSHHGHPSEQWPCSSGGGCEAFLLNDWTTRRKKGVGDKVFRDVFETCPDTLGSISGEFRLSFGVNLLKMHLQCLMATEIVPTIELRARSV